MSSSSSSSYINTLVTFCESHTHPLLFVAAWCIWKGCSEFSCDQKCPRKRKCKPIRIRQPVILEGAVTVEGKATFQGAAEFNGLTTQNGNEIINGTTTLNGALTVNATSLFTKELDVTSLLSTTTLHIGATAVANQTTNLTTPVTGNGQLVQIFLAIGQTIPANSAISFVLNDTFINSNALPFWVNSSTADLSVGASLAGVALAGQALITVRNVTNVTFTTTNLTYLTFFVNTVTVPT
ncbi:MAG: hypothetical protein Sylvanvirus15_11 [Sylvanvirus sp.]|uniref:Uncharacterized protein n=1 Tax=Sylvanvirus sp. TaxID=2487774 RepID=A0A3G5ALT0_9VIRU|nr:MAG: hypothetical protein Sylvanvirus15_11 [Sylvanvirus sp.]